MGLGDCFPLGRLSQAGVGTDELLPPGGPHRLARLPPFSHLPFSQQRIQTCCATTRGSSHVRGRGHQLVREIVCNEPISED